MIDLLISVRFPVFDRKLSSCILAFRELKNNCHLESSLSKVYGSPRVLCPIECSHQHITDDGDLHRFIFLLSWYVSFSNLLATTYVEDTGYVWQACRKDRLNRQTWTKCNSKERQS